MKLLSGNRFLRAGTGLLLTLITSNNCRAAQQPNVLLILTDDQGYGDLSLHGNPILTTPRMDALGKESIRLDEFYVSPVCAPTRASLLTGRYHLRTGVSDVTRRREVLNPSETTIAELFQQNGYSTGCFGKWHNGSVYPETPDGQGFDEFIGFPYGHTTLYFDPVLQHNGGQEQKKGYITDILTDAALNFIDHAEKQNQPFFCYLAYNAPHSPVMASPDLYQKYKKQKFPLSDYEAGVYAMLESLDSNIGRLLDTLDRKGLSKNTLIIFMSDNGPACPRYNAGMKGWKAHPHEGGVRVPCFVRWPAQLQGAKTVTQRLMHIDVLPTLAELCGLCGTEKLDLDGRSFASLLRDPQSTWPDRLLYTFSFGDSNALSQVGAVRTEQWLAVKWWGGSWELYDLLKDPGQRQNTAEQYPWLLSFLREHFEEKLAAYEKDLPGQTPIPVGNPIRPTVQLEAHDANLIKPDGNGIDYSYPAGFAHQWITKWTKTSAYPEWIIDVKTNGTYAISLCYELEEKNCGVELKVCVGENELPVTLNDAYIAPVIPQPFILPEEAKKYETRIWTNRPVGLIQLKPGVQKLNLIATGIPGEQAIDLKAVEITYIQPEG